MNHLTKSQKVKIVKIASPDLSVNEIIKETKTGYNITYKFLVDRGLPFRRIRRPKIYREIIAGYLFNWEWARQVEPNLTTAS